MRVMDRRTGVGLGYDHQPAMADVLGHFIMGGDKLIRIGITAAMPGNAQPGLIFQMQSHAIIHDLCMGAGIAEKGKVVLA